MPDAKVDGAPPAPRGKRGRPAYEPNVGDRARVLQMAGMGLREADIAAILTISEPTLRKYFKPELKAGHVKTNAAVAQTLYKIATDPTHPRAAVAAMFWLKCRAGWREAPDRDAPPGAGTVAPGGVVQFYLPDNGRD